MSDLTDELQVGWHYIEHAKFSNHTIDFFYPTGDWKFSNKESVKKVIAPVPSYEELKKLVEENEALKKKLEIAIDALKEYAATPTYNWIDSQMCAKRALNKINEVLK